MKISEMMKAGNFALKATPRKDTQLFGIANIASSAADQIPSRLGDNYSGTTSSLLERDFVLINSLICGNLDNHSTQVILKFCRQTTKKFRGEERTLMKLEFQLQMQLMKLIQRQHQMYGDFLTPSKVFTWDPINIFLWSTNSHLNLA